MDKHEVYFSVLAFFAELMGSLSGVSSSTLFVPLATLLEGFQIALALTAIIHVIGNSTRALMYWKNVDWLLTFKFGVPSVVFTAVGALFSSWLSAQVYAVILGCFLMAIAVYLFRLEKVKIFNGPWLPYFGGALSGLLTGMVGSGGAIRAAALLAFGLNPTAFLATSTFIDFGGDLIRMIIYLQKGYLNSDHYFYIPIIFVSTLAANFLARHYLQKISQEIFKKIVLSFIFIMGFFTLFMAAR